MMRLRNFIVPMAGMWMLASPVFAQQHEVGLTLGRLLATTRSSPAGALDLDGGVAFQANYGYRLLEAPKMALFAEVHFLANSLREIASINRAATRDLATLYATPGMRVKLLPRSLVSPYVVAGGGYALYEQSFFRIDGASNPASRFTHRGVFNFGGGVDVRVWRFLGARWEIRDFYSGNPSFNTLTSGSGQHNVVIGGGFTLRFGD